jgi:hypothetical protein
MSSSAVDWCCATKLVIKPFNVTVSVSQSVMQLCCTTADYRSQLRLHCRTELCCDNEAESRNAVRL